MFNVGPGELLAILGLALIVLGPSRLPDAVRGAGRVLGHVRHLTTGFQDELRNVLDDSTADAAADDTPAAEDDAADEDQSLAV